MTYGISKCVKLSKEHKDGPVGFVEDSIGISKVGLNELPDYFTYDSKFITNCSEQARRDQKMHGDPYHRDSIW